MLVKIEARIPIFPGTDFHFPSTSVPPGTFLGSTRTWLSRALSSPFSNVMARRTKCTRQQRSWLQLCQIFTDFKKPFLIWLLTSPPHVKYVATLPYKSPLSACFLALMFHKVDWQHMQGVVGPIMTTFLQIYNRIYQWTNFKNGLRFDKNMAMSLMCSCLAHLVYCMHNICVGAFVGGLYLGLLYSVNKWSAHNLTNADRRNQ